jgi:hypothetical protein
MDQKYLDWVEYIKDRVTVHDLLRYYNVPMKNRNSSVSQFSCPFHGSGNDRNPSARVYENGTAYCWGCGESFDTISFVQKYESKSFYESMRFIEKIFKLPAYQIQIEAQRQGERADALTAIFNKTKELDLDAKWSSVNSLLIRNRDSFDLSSYTKICVVLDHLRADTKLSSSEVYLVYEQVKQKILERCSE